MSDSTQFRSDSLYISPKTRSALYLVKLKTGETYPGPDAMADTILWEWVSTHHPEIKTHLDERESRDKAFKETIKPKVPFT